MDPGGVKTASLGRPLGWNRYAYVEGDPINSTDRHGLYMCVGCGDEPESEGFCDIYPDDPVCSDLPIGPNR